MKCIALTGGIATGKSTISALLRQAGIPVIDADQLARQVVAPGSDGLKCVVAKFGQEFVAPNGSLDRQKMSRLIFSDVQARGQLEEIVHPKIATLLLEQLGRLATKGHAWAVYEAPLIFEKNLQENFFATLLVTCSAKTQQQRLMQRDTIDAETAAQRIKSQLTEREKRKLATAVLPTDGELDQLPQQLTRIWFQLTGQLLNLSRAFHPPEG